MRDRVKEKKIIDSIPPEPWQVTEKGNRVKSLAIVSTAYEGIPQRNICSGISPKTNYASFITTARTAWPEDLAWRERTEKALRQIEWSGVGPENRPGMPRGIRGHVCPVCRGREEEGHYSDCELAALLGGADGE